MKAIERAALVVALVVGLAAPAAAQPTPAPAPKRDAPPAPARPDPPPAPAAATVPVYKPPLRGAPGGRVGGGTRGTPRDVFVLSALAPDHSGLTVQEQPTLYWFISGPTSFPVELTFSDPRATQPLVETRLPSPVAAGVHGVRLADHGVRLTPGVQYRWFVAVVPDPGRRSRDILAGGTIERVDGPEGLRTLVAQTSPERLPFVYAEAGLWYDALAAVSALIERAPDNRQHRRARAALLAQVGLPPIDDPEAGAPAR
jgi:hypothetical protein